MKKNGPSLLFYEYFDTKVTLLLFCFCINCILLLISEKKRSEGFLELSKYTNSQYKLSGYEVQLTCVFSLDLGANIGMFTLAVAAMGRKVKAVDATFKNLAYIRWNFFV